MMPFSDYQACVAVQKLRLPKEKDVIIPRRLLLRQRLCLRLGDWLIGFGHWLTQRAHHQNGNSQDFGLA